MKDRAIVTCCYSVNNREYYTSYFERLKTSLDIHSKNASLIAWTTEWPTGSPPHQSMPYAFKYYAVKDAFERGFQKVLWLDAGTQAVSSIEPLWDRVDSHGYALLRGADNLGKWISDYALAKYGYTRLQAKEMTLAGGCLVGLDQKSKIAMEFFEKWEEIARDRKLLMGANRRPREHGGVMRSLMLSDADQSIISEDPWVEGHRSDESCFTLLMDRMKMEPITYTDWLKVCKTY
jgi:hypothetical protein